jgi:hypothetical protein
MNGGSGSCYLDLRHENPAQHVAYELRPDVPADLAAIIAGYHGFLAPCGYGRRSGGTCPDKSINYKKLAWRHGCIIAVPDSTIRGFVR